MKQKTDRADQVANRDLDSAPYPTAARKVREMARTLCTQRYVSFTK